MSVLKKVSNKLSKSISKNMNGVNYLTVILSIILLLIILYIVFNLLNKSELEYFNNKIVLEIYTAPWCGHCKKFESGDKINKIKNKLGERNVKHYIDGEEECAKNMQKYNLGGYPSIIITKDGELVENYSGPREVEQICSFYDSKK